MSGVGIVNASAVNYSTSGVVPVTLPAHTRQDAAIFFVAQKENSGSGSIDAITDGPVKLGEILSTTGTLGADTGPVRIAAFSLMLDGTEESSPYQFTAVGDVAWGIVLIAAPSDSRAIGNWLFDAVVGVDSTGGAAWSATLGSIELQATDLCAVGSVIPTDVTTPSQFTLEAITAAGMTFGAASEIVEPDSSLNTDMGGFIFQQAVATGGPASVAPTVTATASGTTTNVYGATILVRARFTKFDEATTDYATIVTNVGAIDITDLSSKREDAGYLYVNIGAAEVAGTAILEPWGWGENLNGEMREYYYLPGAATYLYVNVT